MANDIWNDLEHRRGDVERHRENATRPARAFAEFRATGVGFLICEAVFRFDCSFIDRPTFTYGVSLGADIDLPIDVLKCSAGVYDWKQTANDYYAGAWCWFNVETWADVDDDFVTIFHLAFEGIGSKDFISSHGFSVAKLDINYE